MKFLKAVLVTVLLVGGAGFLGACGGAEPPSTPEPQAEPTPGVTQPPTPTATSSPTPPDITPAGAPPVTKTTPTPLPTIVVTATPVPMATFTPAPTATFTPEPTPTPTPSPTPTRTPEARVADTPEASADRQSDIIDFTLENITIPTGATVIWTNRDFSPHTSTSGVSPKWDRVWDSPFLTQGAKFSFTFDQPGVFPYWCRLHPDMIATVTVEG